MHIRKKVMANISKNEGLKASAPPVKVGSTSEERSRGLPSRNKLRNDDSADKQKDRTKAQGGT